MPLLAPVPSCRSHVIATALAWKGQAKQGRCHAERRDLLFHPSPKKGLDRAARDFKEDSVVIPEWQWGHPGQLQANCTSMWLSGMRFHGLEATVPSLQPCAPISGTNRTGSSIFTSKSSSPLRMMRTNCCSPPSPTGITNRPPIASCSRSGGGTPGPPAATNMASKGASSRHPTVPSPMLIDTLA